MNSSLFVLVAILAPMAGAALLAIPVMRSRCWSIVMVAVTALSLAVVALPQSFTFEVPTLLIGSQFGLEPERYVLLLVTSAIWFAGALYASGEMRQESNRHRFAFWFLLAMAGNVGLILAQDMINFFIFFALMSFSAYGLVVHRGEYSSRRAGRIYMVFVVIGEVALFVGLALSFGRTESLIIPAIGTLQPAWPELLALTIGFGIKSGLLGLHMWLPFAYPAAPTAGSAVLGGAMASAGLIGFLDFLPPGDVIAPQAGAIILALGISGALYGVLIGLTQRN
ncbi:MAG: proton-conducting transporter membrane subunit, partial [Pseudomonadota bacterium]